jgi:hypothetical protein
MVAQNKQITCYIYTFPKDALPNFNLINRILSEFETIVFSDIVDLNRNCYESTDKIAKNKHNMIPNLLYLSNNNSIEEVLFITQYNLNYDEMQELYESFKLFEKSMWVYDVLLNY